MKLFYSFNFLLLCLLHEIIAESDLDNGIFAFQSPRSFVLLEDPDDASVQHFLEDYDPEERNGLRKIWFQTLRSAVLRAEGQGRALWREGEERSIPYGRLATFLNGLGFSLPEVLPFEEERSLSTINSLRDFLKMHAPSLELVVA